MISTDGRAFRRMLWIGLWVWMGASTGAARGDGVPTLNLAWKHGRGYYDNGDFSPDGSLLVTTGGGGALLWNGTTGEFIRTLSSKSLAAVFYPDGRGVAIINQGRVEVETGVQTVAYDPYTSTSDLLICIEVSRDGRRVAAGTQKSGRILIFDGETGKLLRTIQAHSSDASLCDVTFSPDGTLLASGATDQTAKVWVTETGEPVRTFTNHTNKNWSQRDTVVFTSDGKNLLVDTGDGVQTCNIATGEIGPVFGSTWGPSSMRLINSDSQLLIAERYNWGLYSFPDGAEVSTGQCPSFFIQCNDAISPDGSRIVSYAGRDIDASTGIHAPAPWPTTITPLKGMSVEYLNGGIDPTGGLVYVVPWSGPILVLSSQNGETVRTVSIDDDNAYNHAVELSPSGDVLVDVGSSSIDQNRGLVRFHDSQTGQLLRTSDTGHPALVEFLRISTNGKKILTGCRDGKARIFDYDSGKLLITLNTARSITSGDFSPDGKRCAISDVSDGVSIYDAETSALLQRWQPPLMYFQGGLFFSPDSKILYAGSVFGVLALDVESGAVVSTIKCGGELRAVSPNGQYLYVRDKIVDTRTGSIVASVKQHNHNFRRAQFSPDSRRLMTIGYDGVAMYHEVALPNPGNSDGFVIR